MNFSDAEREEIRFCLNCPLPDCDEESCPHRFFGEKRGNKTEKPKSLSYYYAHHEKCKESSRKYYWKNRDRILQKKKEARKRKKIQDKER